MISKPNFKLHHQFLFFLSNNKTIAKGLRKSLFHFYNDFHYQDESIRFGDFRISNLRNGSTVFSVAAAFNWDMI